MNNGNNGIPVEVHPKFNKIVPSMIFGELLTSSNYDDSKSEQPVDVMVMVLN